MYTSTPEAPAGTEPQLSALVAGTGLLDDVLDAVIMTDLAFRVVRWNVGAAALYGWPADEALGRPLAEIVPTLRYMDGGTRDDALTTLQRTQHWRGAVVQRHRDGHELFVDGSVRVLRDRDQATLGYLAINRDIGERLQLLASEQRARLEAEAAGHRLEVIARASRAFAEANLSLATVLAVIATQVAHLVGDSCILRLLSDDGTELLPGIGYHWDQTANRDVQRLIAEMPRGSREGMLGRVIVSGEPLFLPQLPMQQVRADGKPEALEYVQKYQPHTLIAVPLRIRDEVIGVFALTRDITQRAYTSDDLTLALEIAERAALAIENARLFEASQAAIKVRESFLSIAAHELRTPLTSLLGHVTRLTRRVPSIPGLSDRDRFSLTTIGRQGIRLNRLIEELLDVTRLQQGNLVVERQPLDLRALVVEQAAEFEQQLERHTLVVEAPAEPIVVSGDVVRIEQVLVNLLQNAVKFSPSGGTITVQLVRTARHALLAVTDEGIGIPAADLTKLFQQYYRASNVDPKKLSGLGVGLYLIREIVERHGGTVEVDSREHSGATFRVCLPLLSKATTG